MDLCDFEHDGYMQRLVSKSIFMLTRVPFLERRLHLAKLKVENQKECEDLKEVLTAVFYIMKTEKCKTRSMWPSVEMVRERIFDDVDFPEISVETKKDIMNKKRLYN